MTDRRVHAVLADGSEIVRYDRAGRWYVEEPTGHRYRVRFGDAVHLASGRGVRLNAGLPGGRRFDCGVREARS